MSDAPPQSSRLARLWASRATRAAGAAGLVLALGVAALGVHVLRGTVSTDDAFVEGAMIFVASQVAGRVAEVAVAEHQEVRAGQLLVQLDPADYETRVERAQADLAAARNRMEAAEAAAASAEADQKAAEVELWRTGRELERARSLLARGAASQQQLDETQAAHEAARARVRALGLRADSERAVLGSRAPLEQARAALAQARLDLAHTEIRAPFDGVVGRKNVEPGAIVAPGQPLLSLTASGESWVMANFKETQLRRIRIGDAAEVRLDAFPGFVWRGHVDSFSPATGAKYALIPPEPAAGNFTKVVQRVPVKIVLDGVDGRDGTRAPQTLPLGLSAEVSVRVH
jgi:membrane fusion protein (multidrug efflux system)